MSFERLAERLILHVLTDRDWSRGRDMLTVARAALAGGATVIQLRDKYANTRDLVTEGLALRALTKEYGALLIVNDRIDVALAIDADGAHVGQEDMPVGSARQLLGHERILGVSVGSLDEARLAVEGGADYLGVGPIYATRAKADAGAPIGLALLRELAPLYTPPLIAIGGITAANTHEVRQAGAAGIAVITAIVNAEDITAATQDIFKQLY
ncbi:thiamine phosphate synthase [Tengunoibacter tsumagoiensis]|uniref:Thiamine-phosphate synthase n=1 Tax=Tengunoibacter tsumagoiensis TaxID=2014871 RepID=A0A402AA75_9CHLR|nr:thiamine phosphate synthase [Tengunoibacter tsumagoiensis]GCE15998.1 thiamine-phosphate synthase [Tengunoibacter tsumagoiensis]